MNLTQTDNSINNIIQKKAARNSSIELLKILAIMGIVLGHISGGLGNPDVVHGFNIREVTWDFKHMAVQFMNILCPLGNNIFWICSCWFLVEDNRMSKRKIFGLVIDVWLISILALCIVSYSLGGIIEKEHIKRALFPNLFGNNWYITCYILMYAIHPILNMSIERLSQRGLFRTALSFTLLYIVLSAITPGHFFPSMPTIWVAIYFIVAYIKLYLDNPSKNIRFNCVCIIISIVALFGFIIISNYLETQRDIHFTNVLFWNSDTNPFVVLLALSIFNLIRNYRFENKAINYLAGLTLFVYLIHGNMLWIFYIQPGVWNWIYELDGYKYLILDCFLYSSAVFIGSVLISIAYLTLIKKPMEGIVDKIFSKICTQFVKIESYILGKHQWPR